MVSLAENQVASKGRPRRPGRTVSVKITEEAIHIAKLAGAYTGESLTDYVSRILLERGPRDIEELHARRFAGSRPASKTKGAE